MDSHTIIIIIPPYIFLVLGDSGVGSEPRLTVIDVAANETGPGVVGAAP